MNYFVYIIQSEKDKRYYIGQTANVAKRLAEHNRGKVNSTKHRTPFILIYKEALSSRIEAIKREKHFKSYKNTKDLLLHLDAMAPSSTPDKNIV